MYVHFTTPFINETFLKTKQNQLYKLHVKKVKQYATALQEKSMKILILKAQLFINAIKRLYKL